MAIRSIATAGGGGTLTTYDAVWNPLAAQSPADTDTDYFTDSSLDASWTEFDYASAVTVSEGSDGLKLASTSTAGEAIAGILKAAPSHSTYNITIQIRANAVVENYLRIGLGLTEGTGNTDNVLIHGFLFQTGSSYPWIEVSKFSAYNAVIGRVQYFQNEMGLAADVAYLRAHVTSTTVQFLISANGRNWLAVGDAVTITTHLPAGISHVGILVNNNATSTAHDVYSSMYRVDDTSDPFEPIGSALQARV
jgi:hypothetical protein